MLKPLAVLLAIGGLATAATAQTVQIYGLVDLSVMHQRSGDASALAGGNLTRLSDGTIYGPGSRWGIRVAEDLGGGLKSGVLMESGFFADTGQLAQGGRAFGRQVYIYLGSPTIGDIRLGRQYMFHDETQAVINPTIGTTALNPSAIYTLKTGTVNPLLSAPRIDNAIQYLSPTVGGFQVKAMVSLGEGTQDRYHGLRGTYSEGPILLTAAYEQSKARVVPPGGKSSVNKVFVGGGAYDFGTFKIYGGYEKGKDLTTGAGTQIGTLTLPGLTGAATDLKAYTVGASMPVGQTVLMTNYVRSRFSNASGGNVSIGRFGVGATYSLSKQTSLYAIYAVATGDLKNDVNEKQLLQLGLRKAF